MAPWRSVILATLVAAVVSADVPRLKPGDPLPPLSGETLNGQSVTLPAALSGQPAVLLLGFTYGARQPVEAWSAWCRGPAGVAIACIELPMLGGLAKFARPFIVNGMRKNTPAPLRDRVITVTSKIGDWKSRVGHTAAAENDAYLILVDRAGVVRWQAHGAFGDALAAALAHEVASLPRSGG